MTSPAIECKSVWKIFGNRPRDALDLAQKHGVDKDELFRRTGCVIGVADVSFQVARGEIFCVNISHDHWMKMKRKFSFWDKSGSYAKGLSDGTMVTKKSGRVAFRTHGKKVEMSQPSSTQMTMTVGVGSTCSSGTVTLKRKGSKLVYP